MNVPKPRPASGSRIDPREIPTTAPRTGDPAGYRRRAVSLAAGLLFAVLASAAFAETPAPLPKPAPIPIAVDMAYPPYMFADDGGEARGLYPRIIAVAFRRMDVPVEIRALPWLRALRNGASGETAIGGIYRNPEREAVFDYSAPIARETLRVFVRAGRPFPLATLADLAGKSVGINRGWSYGAAFDRARADGIFRAEEAGDILANGQKLIRGRLDCLIADEIAAGRVLRRHGLADVVVPLPTPLAMNEAFLVFAKSMDRKELLNRFDRTLEAMRADGVYESILREFLDSPDAPAPEPAQ